MAAICLSFFHRKMGPIVQYSCPRDSFPDSDAKTIASLMEHVFIKDQFFTTYLEDSRTVLNYIFEIPSKWATHNKELVMLSTIFDDDTIPTQVEQPLKIKMQTLVNELKRNEETYKGFYFHDRFNFQIDQRKQILTVNATIQTLLGTFYHKTGIEEALTYH